MLYEVITCVALFGSLKESGIGITCKREFIEIAVFGTLKTAASAVLHRQRFIEKGEQGGIVVCQS